MKRILTLLALLASIYSNATVRTVNNNNPSPGQFSTFAAAHTAAVNGDTLYISGSPTNYGGATITKQLTIIGTGHNPDKQNPLVSTFSAINCNAGSANSKFIGINSLVQPLITATPLSFEHCKFVSGLLINITCTLVFKKCVFTAIALSSFGNFTVDVTFNNCILNSSIVASSTGIFAFTGSATNCLFLGNAVISVISFANGYVFSNNIFYGTSPQVGIGNSNSTMINNLSFNCPSNVFGGTTLSGNIVNSNPLFINYVPAGFHSTDNYLLQPASPGHNYGTDGKDIGLYGGIDGVNFRMGGEPSIPQIRVMNVTPATVPSGGTISVNIISTVKL